MGNKPLWVVSSKARPLDGCSIKFDNSEFYFVECLVLALSKKEAEAPLGHALRDEMFELAEVLCCKPYVASEWKDTVQFPEIDEAARKSAQTGNLAFVLFISEESRGES
jgi:hypothetical protein